MKLSIIMTIIVGVLMFCVFFVANLFLTITGDVLPFIFRVTIPTIVVVIFYLVVKRVIKPIKKLTTDVNAVSKGRLDIQLGKSKIFEIQGLIDSLNRVLASLKLAILRTGVSKGELGLGKAIEDKQVAEEALKISEKRFRQVVENSQEWIWEMDSEGLYTYSNPIVEKILGYKTNEIVGKKHFYDFFIPAEEKNLKKVAFAAFAKKESFREFKNKNVDKNGKIVWLLTSGVPILDTKGNLLGYRGLDIDITKQKELLEKHKLFFEDANDLIQRVGTRGKIVEVNKKWRETLGYSNEEALKLTLDKIISPPHLSMCMKEFKKVITGGKVSNVKTTFVTKEGREVPIEINASPVIDDTGKIISTIGIVRIIDEKPVERKLNSKIVQKISLIRKIKEIIPRKDSAIKQTKKVIPLKTKPTVDKLPIVKGQKDSLEPITRDLLMDTKKVPEKKIIISKPIKKILPVEKKSVVLQSPIVKKSLVIKKEKKYFLKK